MIEENQLTIILSSKAQYFNSTIALYQNFLTIF